MLNIETARLSPKKILHHIEEMEQFCMGHARMTPAKFRELNTELSIGAVLLIGSRRYERNATGKHLIWRGMDDEEYDLGPIHDTNVTRDFPGFHAKRSLSLGNQQVVENKTIPTANGRSQMTSVTLRDGSTGIGPNYRMALRNACLKMHLNSKLEAFNVFSLLKHLLGIRSSALTS